jgi:hypothetical protein
MVDLPQLTDRERRNITLTALHQAALDGQKTTLARIHYSHLARAAEEIEQLEKEVARLKELMFDMDIPDR